MAANAICPCVMGRVPAELRKQIFSDIAEGENFTIHATTKTAASHAAQKLYAANQSFTVTGNFYYLLFTCSCTRGPYREALQEYIINDAPIIHANVVDFQFSNLSKVMNLVKKNDTGGLEKFRSSAQNQSKRSLHIHHVITEASSDNFNKFMAFTELCGGGIDIQHTIEACYDTPAILDACAKMGPENKSFKAFKDAVADYTKKVGAADYGTNDAFYNDFEELDAMFLDPHAVHAGTVGGQVESEDEAVEADDEVETEEGFEGEELEDSGMEGEEDMVEEFLGDDDMQEEDMDDYEQDYSEDDRSEEDGFEPYIGSHHYEASMNAATEEDEDEEMENGVQVGYAEQFAPPPAAPFGWGSLTMGGWMGSGVQ